MRKIDITGQKFGKLTAIAPCQDKKGYWTFKCDCGRYVEMRKNSVMSGHALSCGCSRKKKHSDKTWEDFIEYAKRIEPNENIGTFVGNDFFTINNLFFTKDFRVLVDAEYELFKFKNYSDMIKLLKLAKENLV